MLFVQNLVSQYKRVLYELTVDNSPHSVWFTKAEYNDVDYLIRIKGIDAMMAVAWYGLIRMWKSDDSVSYQMWSLVSTRGTATRFMDQEMIDGLRLDIANGDAGDSWCAFNNVLNVITLLTKPSCVDGYIPVENPTASGTFGDFTLSPLTLKCLTSTIVPIVITRKTLQRTFRCRLLPQRSTPNHR